MLGLPSWKYWLSRSCCGWGQGDWPKACGQPWIEKFGLRDGESERWTRFLMNVNRMNGPHETEPTTFHQGLWSPRRLTRVSPNTQGSRGPRHNPRLAGRGWVCSLSCGCPPQTSQRRPALPHGCNAGNQSPNRLGQQTPSSEVFFSLCSLCWGCFAENVGRQISQRCSLSDVVGDWNCLPREEGKSSPVGAHSLPIRRMDSGDRCLSARSYCCDHRGKSCTASTSLSCEIESSMRTSPAVRGLGVCLPMQGTQVWSLVQEDSAHHKATTPKATTTEPALWNPKAAATEARIPYSPRSTIREATTRKRPRTAEKGAASTRCN